MRVKYNFFEKAVKKLTGYKWLQFKYNSFKLKNIYTHKQLVEASNYDDVSKEIKFFPSCSPNWDHTPRSGNKGQVIVETNPELFYQNLNNCYNRIKDYKNEEKIIFIKAWNEWAEGNYLEPDLKNGSENLEKVKRFQEESN
jgi:hypothetical protein